MGVTKLTSFGKELRKFRVDKNIVLTDMANMLGFTAAYISAIENGKRAIPVKFIDKIENHYFLSKESLKKLKIACIETQESINISFPDNFKENHCFIETAYLLSEKFPLLNEAQIEKIRDVLLEVGDN